MSACPSVHPADTEAKRAAATANLQKLQTGVEALLVLAETLPLVDVRFAVVGRLDGSTGAFLDFQHSDPIARYGEWHRYLGTAPCYDVAHHADVNCCYC